MHPCTVPSVTQGLRDPWNVTELLTALHALCVIATRVTSSGSRVKKNVLGGPSTPVLNLQGLLHPGVEKQGKGDPEMTFSGLSQLSTAAPLDLRGTIRQSHNNSNSCNNS